MNTFTRTALAFAVVFAAVAAPAAERNVFDTETDHRAPPAASAPGYSLEQSRQGVLAARADGSLNPFDTLAYLSSGRASASFERSRAEVRAELAAARASAEWNSFDNLAYLRQAPSARLPDSVAMAPR